MSIAIADITQLVGGNYEGESGVEIAGVNGLKEAVPGELSFLANEKYIPLLEETAASAVLVAPSVSTENKVNLIKVEDPNLAFAQVIEAYFVSKIDYPKGVHPSAHVDETAELGAGVSVGPNVTVMAGAKIGQGTVLQAGTYVGHNAVVGPNCNFSPCVSVMDRCVVGQGVTIHSGTVIGSDGFGFTGVEGVHVKIVQAGIVEIGDDVEIGSNVCVDRARFGKTTIGKGTKIDNLIQIAHNVQIGEHCVIASLSGLSGSAKIGNHVTVAAQVGLAGHIEVGDYTVLGARSGVTKSVPAKQLVSGFPAIDHKQHLKARVLTGRLPEMLESIKELTKKIEELEKKADSDS